MWLYNLLTLLLVSISNITNVISTTNTYKVLALSGGGSFGAVEIGILDKINSMEPKK